MFLFCAGRIWLERKGEAGLLQTRPHIFLFCDSDTKIQEGLVRKEGRGWPFLWTRSQMFMFYDININIQEDFGWPFTDKTTDLSAL